MFKESFKYYKSKSSAPNLNDVINFSKEDTLPSNVRKSEVNKNVTENFVGLIPPVLWKVYSVENNPGLLFIKNPFKSLGERYWIIRCLQHYTKKPNILSIDKQGEVPENFHWWEYAQKEERALLKKLRWATLGYHHNWDTKVYSENLQSEFPEDLAFLCSHIAKVLGFEDFKAEAAIVNFYHMDSTLSGHTDHSEQNLDAPLFSISFGQTAIFLLGGKTVDIKPNALLLENGDIVVMSGESRLSYHGVPRVIYADDKNWPAPVLDSTNDCKYLDETVLKNCGEYKYWQPFEKYICNSRINLNVRQVLKKGRTSLDNKDSISFYFV